MAQTLFDKLWEAHVVTDIGDGSALLYIDRIFLHERTGSVALKSLQESGRRVRRPSQAFGTMDHIVDTLPGRTDDTLMPSGRDFITAMRQGCAWAGIRLFDIDDADQGIVHVISPEQGIVLPGLTLVCPDSHTCSQGAFGALAWGIGSTEAEHALATTTLKLKKPKSMRVTLSGTLRDGVSAKDLMLALIAQIGASGASGHVVEFCGDVVTAMDMEARMTLCNMATELAAFSAVIAPDETTVRYLEGRPFAPKGDVWNSAVKDWRALASDAEATFDREIILDANSVAPMVSWGTNPGQSVPLFGKVPTISSRDTEARQGIQGALDYVDLMEGQALQGVSIDAAFIGSCTNSRLSDLRVVASILKGRKVAGNVRAICVPGSMQVKRAAESEGLDKIIKDAGFEWRLPGCSMCFFAGGESFGPKARVISTTNRNFENRQGSGTRTHIASPATVAASAVMGYIADPRDMTDTP